MSTERNDLNCFHNSLRILASIDRHELADAGLMLDDAEWSRFASNPWAWLIRAGDEDMRAVWSIIQARQPRRLRERETV